ncbi:MAG: NAD(P)H-hydrate dehydratase [Sedimentisphaerales bacterium]|nr:NAD(P)H-hydrate dehydratase [Sedimentisphaerales bacterium]
MQKITTIPQLPLRAKDAHKGMFGKVLIIAGSRGMTGAAAIAGRAALRSGAGLVRVATPASVLPIVASIEPCYTTIPLPEGRDGQVSARAIDIILSVIEDNDVIAFGPGLGQSSGVKDVLYLLIGCKDLRLVIDADGLNCLAKSVSWIRHRKASIILTPHPGEMKRLWGSVFRTAIPSDRVQTAVDFAHETDCTIVLKGAGTVVAEGEKFYHNETGNPGMATAGSGDVLTGIITALVGQGLSHFEAAVLGVYIHGRAGDLAAAERGQISLIATDIIDSLGKAFQEQAQ